MKKTLALTLIILLITTSASCATQKQETPSAANTAMQTAPASETSPVSGLSEEEEAIAAASSIEDLKSLISVYILDRNYPMALKAADRLLELDPTDDDFYAMKARLLILTLQDAYASLNGVIAEAAANVDDPNGYNELVQQMYDEAGLVLVIPFLPDYASADEINTVGTSARNLASIVIQPDFSAWQTGVFTTQGSWIYFSEPGENYALYKMRPNRRERFLVCPDGAGNLNVIGDWIYFSNSGDNNTLYKIRTDGSLKTKLADDRCDSLCVTGDWVYYLNADDGNTIYKIRTDGSGRAPFYKQAGALFVDEDWLYFSSPDENSVLRIRLDGTDEQMLLDGIWSIHICMYDGWFYFMTDRNGLVVMKMPPDASAEPEEVWRYDAKINFFAFTHNKMIAAVRSASDTESILVFDLVTMEQLLQIDAVTDSLCTAGGDDVFFVSAVDFEWYKIMWDTGQAEKMY